MRKVFSKFLILLLLLTFISGGVGVNFALAVDFSTAVAAVSPAASLALKGVEAATGAKTGGGFLDIPGYIASGMMSFIQYANSNILTFIIVPVVAKALEITSKMMDITINFSMDTSNYKNDSFMGSSIEMGWIIVRDLLNMTLIFILLYQSILITVSKASLKGNQTIISVIIAAVAVNFSLLIAKWVLDFGNIFAISIKNSIAATIAASGVGGSSMGANIGNLMGLWNYYNVTQPGVLAQLTDYKLGMTTILNSYSMIALMCISIWVFLKVTMIFLMRTISIAILLISSPIYFFGAFGKDLKKYADDWWSNLIAVAISPSIFFLFMYVVIKIINSQDFINYLKSLSASEDGWKPQNYLLFALVMGFIWKAAEMTKEHSGTLGDFVMEKAKMAAGYGMQAAGIMTGGAGMLIAQPLAKAVAGSASLKGAAASGGIRGSMAKLTLSTAKIAEKSTFDVRNAKIPGLDTAPLVGNMMKKAGLSNTIGQAMASKNIANLTGGKNIEVGEARDLGKEEKAETVKVKEQAKELTSNYTEAKNEKEKLETQEKAVRTIASGDVEAQAILAQKKTLTDQVEENTNHNKKAADLETKEKEAQKKVVDAETALNTSVKNGDSSQVIDQKRKEKEDRERERDTATTEKNNHGGPVDFDEKAYKTEIEKLDKKFTERLDNIATVSFKKKYTKIKEEIVEATKALDAEKQNILERAVAQDEKRSFGDATHFQSENPELAKALRDLVKEKTEKEKLIDDMFKEFTKKQKEQKEQNPEDKPEKPSIPKTP